MIDSPDGPQPDADPRRSRRLRTTVSALRVLLMAGVVVPALVATSPLMAHPAAADGDSTAPTARELLAKVNGCDQVSTGLFQRKEDTPADVPICGKKGAVFFTADMNIDCDGRVTDRCNKNTDCCFQPDTAFHQSDGQPLDSSALPYIVLHRPNGNFDYTSHGIDGGSVVAVIYRRRSPTRCSATPIRPTRSGRRRTRPPRASVSTPIRVPEVSTRGSPTSRSRTYGWIRSNRTTVRSRLGDHSALGCSSARWSAACRRASGCGYASCCRAQ